MSTAETPKTNGNNGSSTKQTNGKGNGAKVVKAHGADQLNHRELLSALRAFKRGNFDVKLREDLTGIDGQIVETFNELVSMVKAIRDESHEVCDAVGKEGQAAKRMRRFGTTGGWSAAEP